MAHVMDARILIVEDERQIARFLELELMHEGFQPEVEDNGRKAYERIMNETFDLILLDWMLPDMDGMEICREVRKATDVPIIMLTAKTEVKDKVAALDLGADDYVTKPFVMEELLARIKALLRTRKKLIRSLSGDEPEMLKCANVTLDCTTREVHLKGRLVEMTRKEFQVLELLMQAKNTVLTRDQILMSVWGFEYSAETNLVDVYIRYLRQKLEYGNNTKFIFTVRGVGYVVKD